MSGNDIIAILCLLLAGGGLAYLVRSSRKVKDVSVPEPAEEQPSRTAQTIPPKLRAPSGQPSVPPSRREDPPSAPVPPKAAPSSAGLPGAEKKKKRSEGKQNPGSFTASPIKATLVSSGTDEIAKIAERAAEKKVEVTTAPPVKPAAPPASTPKPVTAEAKKAEPAKAPEPKAAEAKKPDAKAPEAKAPEAKAPEAKAPEAKAPEAKAPEAKAPEAKAPEAKAPEAKAPEAKKPVKPPPPSKNAIPAAKVTPKTTIVAGSSSPIVTPPKKKDALADIPKLSVEEDDDVEPTKVGKLIRREIQPPVEKHVVDEGADKDATPVSKPMHVAYATAQTDPGRRRKQNEDSYLLLEKEGLFVVADGMGGHRGGQVASKLAVKTIGDAFEKKKFEAAAHPELPPAASELARSMQMANAAIQEEAKVQPDLKGMGTTLVAARFTADRQRLYIGHVGDSRCYRIRDGAMKQITTDHTMADYGVAGPEGAHLSRAVGVWPTVPIDILMASPQLGDTYLICSDGLTKMLTNETIATQITHEDDPKAAVNRLVMFANAHGGKDNITVILIRIVAPDWKPPS